MKDKRLKYVIFVSDLDVNDENYLHIAAYLPDYLFSLMKTKCYSIKIVTLPTLCKENTSHDINRRIKG